jgi:hypothetical protein
MSPALAIPARCEAHAAASASAIARLDANERARVLGHLLALVGPLAMAVLGGGAFAKYVRVARKAFVPVTLEDAARATWTEIHELVRYLQQSHPKAVAGWGSPPMRGARDHAGLATIR